ncbi:hypothetical protein HPB51_027131 [Rhipicephalus microplus]|uniref:HTH CENPB-type domain-containing protein n=1 Tax=Rhipicephalus microplus TaxID=6941 RepID=A0A9J6D0Y5_RHIMP|nr:hypothetical protein HPB51_027131 [Rhipicephalus microplus]
MVMRAVLRRCVVKWLKAARSESLPISGPLLVEKALVFASQLNHDNFVCSNGWLARFKARHGITTRTVSAEGAAADVDGAEQWQNSQLKNILEDYAPDDIFNMDESTLFFKLLPDKTLTFDGETCTGGKHAKDRISVAFCINMTGTDKTPLLVIEKLAKPRCFKGIRLPSEVVYRINTKAWMTAKFFEEYVHLIDRRFAAKNRRVVIILDNSSVHVPLDDLTAVKLAFLPSNTTGIAQPLDQGIIRAVKQFYKKNLLRRFLLAIECGKLFSINLIGTIYLLEYSWRQIEATAVQNCFKRAGFIVCAGDADDASDTIDQTSDIVDEACKTLLAEVLERQGLRKAFSSATSEMQTAMCRHLRTCPTKPLLPRLSKCRQIILMKTTWKATTRVIQV